MASFILLLFLFYLLGFTKKAFNFLNAPGQVDKQQVTSLPATHSISIPHFYLKEQFKILFSYN